MAHPSRELPQWSGPLRSSLTASTVVRTVVRTAVRAAADRKPELPLRVTWRIAAARGHPPGPMRSPGVGNVCDGGSRSCDVRVRMCRPRRRDRCCEPARARDTRRELGTRRIAIWRARLPNRRMGKTPPGSDRDNAPGPSRRESHRSRSVSSRTACCGVRRGACRGHRTYSRPVSEGLFRRSD